VSQPTLHRILRSAHAKVADALVNGKALRIDGGPYELPSERWFRCFTCQQKWSESFGTGRPKNCPQCDSHYLRRLAQSEVEEDEKL
jgi:DNA-directed RNA polymerase subunit RPC12/RpoP